MCVDVCVNENELKAITQMIFNKRKHSTKIYVKQYDQINRHMLAITLRASLEPMLLSAKDTTSGVYFHPWRDMSTIQM